MRPGALGFAVAVCLYLLYFAQAADIAGEALARAPEARRSKIARDGYTFAHFPMIAGIIYVAVGIEEVLVHITHGGSPTAGERLGWPAVMALYSGAALYLAGRAAFLRLTAGPVPQRSSWLRQSRCCSCQPPATFPHSPRSASSPCL